MRDEAVFQKLYANQVGAQVYIPHYHGGLLRATFPLCECRKIDIPESGLFKYPDPKARGKNKKAGL